jgi:transposase
MFHINEKTRVFLKTGATDLRNAFEGLRGLVVQIIQQQPLSGHLFIFCNKGRNRIKCLTWDGSGMWVCAKKLEGGTFDFPKNENGVAEMSCAQLKLLLEGFEFRSRRGWYRR